jgi:NADPH:quinone reductase-like Zn-dependent oxidoreductase
MIDYTKEDFTKNGKKYDLILDAVGGRTFFSCRRSLTETGIYISEHPLKPKHQLMQWIFSLLIRDKRIKTHLSEPNSKDLEFLRELIEEEKLRPRIEKIYPLDQIVEAHRHVENGHTKGKVVIEIQKA